MAKAANQSYIFEFDEADVWFNNNNNDNFNPTPVANHFEPAAKKMVVPSSFRSCKKRVERKTSSSSQAAEVTCASSLPVNIPDWSQIYKGSYRGCVLDDDHHGHDQESDEDHDAGGDQESRIPPHEFLARRRGASFSVHEGIGRTLKGRDLRQVRNAIWKKVGFED